MKSARWIRTRFAKKRAYYERTNNQGTDEPTGFITCESRLTEDEVAQLRRAFLAALGDSPDRDE